MNEPQLSFEEMAIQQEKTLRPEGNTENRQFTMSEVAQADAESLLQAGRAAEKSGDVQALAEVQAKIQNHPELGGLVEQKLGEPNASNPAPEAPQAAQPETPTNSPSQQDQTEKPNNEGNQVNNETVSEETREDMDRLKNQVKEFNELSQQLIRLTLMLTEGGMTHTFAHFGGKTSGLDKFEVAERVAIFQRKSDDLSETVTQSQNKDELITNMENLIRHIQPYFQEFERRAVMVFRSGNGQDAFGNQGRMFSELQERLNRLKAMTDSLRTK